MFQTDIPPARRRAVLREALGRTRAGGRTLRFQAVTTPVQARRAAACGLDGIHLEWDALAASLGDPETGPGDLLETVARTAQIVRAVPLPVLVGLGPRSGGRPDVVRVVRALEGAGVTGIQLDGRPPVPDPSADDDVTDHVAAAVRARRDPDLLIGVHATAHAAGGLIDTVDRSRAYVTAGADLVLVDGPETISGYTVLREALTVPLLAVETADPSNGPSGPLPLTAAQLADLGMDVVIHPVAPQAPTDRGRPASRDTRPPPADAPPRVATPAGSTPAALAEGAPR